MASYNYMMSADEVAQELNCSKSHAYKLVKAMNKELSAQGYITMAGRIPKAFWAKKMYFCTALRQKSSNEYIYKKNKRGSKASGTWCRQHFTITGRGMYHSFYMPLQKGAHRRS